MDLLGNNLGKLKKRKMLMKELASRSTKAVCGITEREVVVSTQNVPRAIAAIKASGKIFVGKGPAGPGKTKLWFATTGF